MAAEEPNKILVVDDSPQISKALSDLLSAGGYSVRTAPSAERALQILESATFDLIITDLKMTGMTGIDLAKQVLQKTPGMPVVILTGFGDMDSVINALRLGVADYLKKPFAIDEVMSVVEREIAKSKDRQAAPTEAKPAEKPPRLYIFAQRDLQQIEAVLSRLRAQATAESAMLVEQAGYVIAAKGMSSGADVEPLSTLSPAPDRLRQTCVLLGETQDFPPTMEASASRLPPRWGAACTWP
jgi:DNA-binding NtrC family response regulator